MINALVIDLEFWYSAELLKRYAPQKKIDQIPESLNPILELLDRYDVTATFAVLGSLAEQHPELVKDIHNQGHEIASHAYSHTTLYELNKKAFENEIKKSISLLKSITGENPIGFRAPSFSLNNSTKWALDVLEEYGFKYDASIFPFATMLYGVPNAPLSIYRPSKVDITKHDANGRIIEFPMTVLKIVKNIPICGGFYLRTLPLWLVKYGIRSVNKTRPAIIYIHPWETYIGTPRLELPSIPKFITYHNLNSTLDKLNDLLREFEFTSIKNVLSAYYELI